MMRSPPTDVPRPMMTLHSSISHTGITTPATLDCPLQNAMPRNSTR